MVYYSSDKIVERIIFVETNFAPENIIHFKKSQTAIEIASLGKGILFIRHNRVHE